MVRITAVLQGFNAPTRNVELLVGQTAVVNLQMSPTGVAESITVTGQVFRAVGNSISHYVPWTVGTEIVSKDEGKWNPEDIGNAVYSKIFKSRHPGLQMGQ